jgi:hypothetical protein
MGSPALAPDLASTEAVIISGARRGEIIRLPGDDIEWATLNKKLDALNDKLQTVSQEVRAFTKTLKSAK